MENWLPVVGYEGRYEVSDLGRVRNVRRDKIIVLLNAKGYRRVGLFKNAARELTQVHRLVCEAFLEERPPGKPQINHKNGVRDDNRLENLEYCDASENSYHKTRVLHRASGEDHYKCRLPWATIETIRALWRMGMTQTAIAKLYEVTQAHISQVVLGKSRISG